MPLKARRFVQKMRGGAQAHLLEATDGACYVVKFLNNPQHRRILINEWLAGIFLEHLQIAAPRPALIELDEEFLAANPQVGMQFGAKHVPVTPGWHFGSPYPGDPARLAVYDFVPDPILETVTNLRDFRGAFVFDKWMANADSRQAIFFRARIKEWAHEETAHPRKLGFVALMIDHGFVFNGPHWEFPDSPLLGRYHRPLVYQTVRGWEDLQPWLDQVMHFPESVVDDALRQLPAQWIAEDAAALEELLEKLMRRRRRMPELVEQAVRDAHNPFPQWVM